MTRVKWIKKFVSMHKGIFLLAFVNITIMTMIDLIYPFLNGVIVNIAFYEQSLDKFLNICTAYIIMLFFNQFIIATFNNLISSQLMTSFVFDIRRALFRKILRLKGESLANIYSGDMINRMNTDATDFMNLIFTSILSFG